MLIPLPLAPVYSLLFKGTMIDGLIAAPISAIIYIANFGISKIDSFNFSPSCVGIIAGSLTIFAQELYPSLI